MNIQQSVTMREGVIVRIESSRTVLVAGILLAASVVLSGCTSSSQSQKVPSASPGSAATSTDTLETLHDYFGIVPEDVTVPDGVKTQFAASWTSVVRSALISQYVGNSITDLQQNPSTNQTSRDLLALSMDNYMTEAMQTDYKDNFAKALTNSTSGWNVFQLTPLEGVNGTFTINGNKMTVDDSKRWIFYYDNILVESAGSGDGLQKNGGVYVSFDRSTVVPTKDNTSNIVFLARIKLLMTPGIDKQWLIDGFSYQQNAATLIAK